MTAFSPEQTVRAGPSWMAAALSRGALPALVFAAGTAALLLVGMQLAGGTFAYTMDDAYIHLALSEQLRGGHYGIHPSEASAPASSILWPVLLVPFADASWHRFVPLALNLAAGWTSVAMLCRLLGSVLPGEPWFRDLIAVVIAVSAGFFSLALSGMEHSVHVLLTLGALLGLQHLFQTGRATSLVPATLFLAPLVRYEGIGLTLLGCAALWTKGERRLAIGVALASAAALGAFSLFLMTLGLAPLPSSVLVKSAEALQPGASALALMAKTLDARIGQAIHLGVLAPAAGLLGAAMFTPRARPLAAVILGLVLLHLIAGRWEPRYVSYLLAATGAGLAITLAPQLCRLAESGGRIPAAALVLLVSAAPFLAGLRLAIERPLASRDVVLQQTQMHRFAAEFYRGAVAVNDLGRVSYRNPFYVLDLWGLGSERSRRARLSGEPGWAETLLAERGVGVVMVYDEWLAKDVPCTWMRLGTLLLGRRPVSAWSDVAFYAAPDAAPRALEALRRFAPTLPPPASFDFAVTSTVDARRSCT